MSVDKCIATSWRDEMIKIYPRYHSFLHHLAANYYPFALTFQYRFYLRADEKLRISEQRSRDYPYNRFFPKSQRVRILLAGFQPIADMQKDAVNTFKPYKSSRHVWRDLAQPVYGVINIIGGILTFVGALLYTLAAFIISDEHQPQPSTPVYRA